MSVSCIGDITQRANGTIRCNGTWIQEPSFSEQLQQFSEVLASSFSLDLQLFGTLIVASTVSFITGHTVGEIIKRLNRT